MPANMENYNAEFNRIPKPRVLAQKDLPHDRPWGGWTMLDQKIALLKGWEFDPMEFGWWRTPEEKACGQYVFGGLHWSSDDREAMDLLPEIPGEVILTRLKDGGWYVSMPDALPGYSTVAPALAVAVCRAYIAMMEAKG